MDKEAINKRFLDAISYLLSSKTVDSKGKLANTLGIKATKFSEILNNRMSIGTDLAALICVEYEICPDWLLTGRGSMLRTEQAQFVPQPAVHPVVQQDLSGEAAAYYKMYEKEKEENKIKVEELTTKMLQMAEEIGNLKAQVGTKHKEPKAPDHPPLAFDGGFIEDFTEAPSGGSTKDYAHMRKPTTIKKSSTSKT